MTCNEAAIVIDCSAIHVRYLCRKGKLKATKQRLAHDPNGFEYRITLREAQRYRDNRPRRGPKPRKAS